MMDKNKHIDDNLLSRFLLKETSEEENQEVNSWLAQSEKNQEDFDSFKKAWALSGTVHPKPVNIDVDAAWDKMSRRIDASSNDKKLIQFHPFYKYTAAVAALIVIVFGIRFYTNQQSNSNEIVQKYVTVDVPKVEKLIDGSKVTINKNSSLSLQNFDTSREMTLKGEAYFEVAHNKDKPFIVHTQKGDITVLGTKFNVKEADGKLEVTVTEGLVKLASLTNKDDFVLLKANTKGEITTSSPIKEENTDVNSLFWVNKKLSFKDIELTTLIKTVEDNYGVKITIKNEKLYHKKVTTSFENDSITDILQVLEATLDLKVEKVGEKTYSIE
ncbi:DUF4974 domain-containing protein [Flammeovirga kamogawensis]|nr:DUF4974 domain-containing protein [Flammeovirga kamogawensis]